MSDQVKKLFYLLIKDIRAYYLKPPLITWGLMFPAVLVLAFYLRSPGQVTDVIPGLIGMTILFGATSIEAVVIAFEKRVGSLDRLIMAPLHTSTLLMGKLLGGVLFGILTGAMLLLVSGRVWDLPLPHAAWLPLVFFLSGLAFASFGTLVAVSVQEVFEAMTLANYFRFPMIFLCGVFVPVLSMPLWIRPLSYVLPLTYTVDALRICLLGKQGLFGIGVHLILLMLFTIVLFSASVRLFNRRYVG